MVRFRNGALVEGLIRKDSNGPWMPVGTNGCPQGYWQPGQRRCPASSSLSQAPWT
jgi:hypothetical protein